MPSKRPVISRRKPRLPVAVQAPVAPAGDGTWAELNGLVEAITDVRMEANICRSR